MNTRLQTPTGQRLARREGEVLLAIAKGNRPRAIAAELGISVKTVGTYRTRILEKMGMRSNAELAVWADRRGLLQS